MLRRPRDRLHLQLEANFEHIQRVTQETRSAARAEASQCRMQLCIEQMMSGRGGGGFVAHQLSLWIPAHHLLLLLCSLLKSINSKKVHKNSDNNKHTDGEIDRLYNLTQVSIQWDRQRRKPPPHTAYYVFCDDTNFVIVCRGRYLF